MAKEPACSAGDADTWVQSLGQENPLEKEMQPTPVVLPGKSHGQRSLAGPSPWGLKRVRHDLPKLNINNPNNGIPLSDKEEGTADIRNSMHESQKLN